jgi:hypothetical protein
MKNDLFEAVELIVGIPILAVLLISDFIYSLVTGRWLDDEFANYEAEVAEPPRLRLVSSNEL